MLTSFWWSSCLHEKQEGLWQNEVSSSHIFSQKPLDTGPGVTADLDPPRICTLGSRSASGFGPPGPNPVADMDPLLRIWNPPENKRSIE